MIPLSRPEVTDADRAAVDAVLRTPHLSGGSVVGEFEAALAAVAGTQHAVCVSSGTAGLHLSALAVGVGEGAEVVTTPFSFVASTNCFLYERARPVFVDIDPRTLNIDPVRAVQAVTGATGAILPVDVFGLPYDHAALFDAMGVLPAAFRDVPVIEDACEALGARCRGRSAGSLGDVGVYAFYPNKQITTGEGGAVLTDDEGIADQVRRMRNQGRAPGAGWLAHETLGYNYRMDEIRAALGLSQLRRLPVIVAARRRVAGRYHEALADLVAREQLDLLPDEVDGAERSWFVYVVLLADGIDRDAVIQRLAGRGVESRAYFPPIHLQPYLAQRYGYQPGAFPVTEAVARRALALPFHNLLADDEVGRVVEALTGALG